MTQVRVLVVDDDFRVADLHAGIVSAMGGFDVVAVAGTLAAARDAVQSNDVDLALVDVYLPDGSGIEFVRELRCDAFILGAASAGVAVRDAMTAGALVYLVKPFADTELARRLGAYLHYRRIVADRALDQSRIDSALASLRAAPKVDDASPQQSVTRSRIVELLAGSDQPLSAAEVAAEIGVSRATAQRYLAALVAKGRLRVRLRYGATGRPEQEYTPVT